MRPPRLHVADEELDLAVVMPRRDELQQHIAEVVPQQQFVALEARGFLILFILPSQGCQTVGERLFFYLPYNFRSYQITRFAK
jgi:hypothetical protein